MSIPRADGQSRGRSFIPDQKLAHLAAYEQAGHERQGGAYLSLEGVYSSVMSKCGRLRDAGVLEGKTAGETLGRPSAERAEIAPMRRQVVASARRLVTTLTASDIMGKAHSLSEFISESAENEQPRKMR